jgi:hypothetical protein
LSGKIMRVVAGLVPATASLSMMQDDPVAAT